jgi:hypothetical protein
MIYTRNTYLSSEGTVYSGGYHDGILDIYEHTLDHTQMIWSGKVPPSIVGHELLIDHIPDKYLPPLLMNSNEHVRDLVLKRLAKGTKKGPTLCPSTTTENGTSTPKSSTVVRSPSTKESSYLMALG